MIELSKIATLAWRKFIQSDSGSEGMLFLRERVPSITKGDHYEMIFDAGRAEGYKQAIDTISELLTLKKEETQDPSNDQ